MAAMSHATSRVVFDEGFWSWALSRSLFCSLIPFKGVVCGWEKKEGEREDVTQNGGGDPFGLVFRTGSKTASLLPHVRLATQAALGGLG